MMDREILGQVKTAYKEAYQRYERLLSDLSPDEAILKRLAYESAFLKAIDFGMDSVMAKRMAERADLNYGRR